MLNCLLFDIYLEWNEIQAAKFRPSLASRVLVSFKKTFSTCFFIQFGKMGQMVNGRAWD